jgi:hypothetical protein
VALEKPSDYFKKDITTVNNCVEELAKAPELNTFSDAFESFKNNLSKIEVISEFSDTLDNYRVNIERVNHLSKNVEDIQTEIQTLLKKEDLDRAMMSQLLVVEQSIRDVQNKVKGINENKLTEIRLDVSGLTESVNEFLEVEVPKYKKLIVDSELRTDNRFTQLEENVNQTLEGIGEFVDNKYQKLTESIQGINEQSLAGILEEFKLIDENFANLKKEEIPKYKGFIVETERKTEKKLEDLTIQVSSQLSEFQENVDEKISTIQTSLKEFVEIEAPKYNKLLIENKLKTEAEVKEIQKNIEEKVSLFVEDIKTLKSDALSESKEIDKFVTEKIVDFKKVLTETQKDVKKTLSTYTSISKTFESKVNSDNEKLNSYDETLKDFSVKIGECLSQVLLFKEEIEINEEIQNEWKDVLREELSQRIKEYREELNEEVTSVQNDLTKKVSDLEIDIVRNESHLKVQNKNLEQIQEDVKTAIKKLNLEELEEKNHELSKKIKYLEEVFEKFSEKEILTENIIAEPPPTDNKDPLTPLNQNFVTLDQLQQHYRLFINRIQQQLASIGGGGETRLEFLDDVDRNSAKTNGYVLQYDSSVGKFIGTSYVSGSGGDSYWSETNAGIYTTGNVAIGTDVVSTGSTALWVQGDARITGILSVGTGTITLDPTENTIRVGTGITLDATNNIVSIGTAITLNSNTGVIEVKGSIIGSPSGDANYTGIVTASAFAGDGSGLTGIVAAGSGIEVKDNNTLVGTASTLNFGTDLDVTLSGGVASINVSIPLSALTDVNTSNLSGITTDYLMVYDPTVPGFKFVNPKTYFGINNDFNPAPDIVDYGSY